MTRINSGINPKQLSQKHLIAEHREIIRIPNTISSGKAVVKNIPNDFRLGSGHVKFFYDKLFYLLKRYKAIYDEGINRGYNLTNFSQCWDHVPKELMNDWKPTQNACNLIRERIYERGGYFVSDEPFII